MVPRKFVSLNDASPLSVDPTNFSKKVHEKAKLEDPESSAGPPMEADVDIDLAEVYFLIMHFLSTGPCQRTCGHFLNELLEHQLLPRRYHAWYSRSGLRSGYEEDNGLSFPLSYNKFVERYPHIENDHLVKLLKQLLLSNAPPLHGMTGGNTPNAADVPTLLGSGSLSLLDSHKNREDKKTTQLPGYLRWPHMQADQVRGLCLREIGGGFRKHHRAPSIRAACYTIAKPSMMMQKMQITKKLRGHRDAVYCAIFDRAGRHVITGSDDRLVKIWSMETAFCLSSCRGHEGDITDLSVSSNNAVVASSSNDCTIRVWRLPDGLPISVLRGHTTAVTAIAFSPRPGAVYQLLSSSDDGSCRIWDARSSQFTPRVYIPKPPDVAGKSNGHPPNSMLQEHRIVCCAFNANGTAFVTGSSDACARVWSAVKFNSEDSNQPNHEMDVLSGHENVVNYVQFSGCAVPSRASTSDASKEENLPKFKNSWFTHDNIVTCSRDGSAIIWTPRSRKSHGKVGHWMRTYHLKVPPPPMPPRGGPRQKSLPTPRGVNMIVWSLDNRFVLAPITDCRICVWNAADGSLVHSLTGHSDSTYVLDVHPFNPRIAMSAGYDGKIIVWDIWDGSPVRIYETGHFKLVDGKFSPDGTSILLSDDVGQIYILSSGQGESHKDAKYDQFFLGDYHPLTQDTHGNVLDQETQLAPHRRNIQDLLCDSSLTPYPDPYQSMYQQRRLGALGIEWRPPPVKFSIGPAENGHPGIQDYQILPPLPDLDRLMEPLPEFVDTMDWQQENEVQSDDTDSEYNVPEEYVGEGEHGSVNAGSSSDLECTGEDSEDDNISKEGFRRSKRKKIKVDFTTSTGRRVKRKNLDEWDTSLKSNKRKKVKHGKSATRRRKSSASKSLRPQRLAARNALNLFSQINGASTDGEDEVSSESDLSDGESILPDSNIQSNDSDRSLQNVQQKHPRERETSPDVSETAVKPPKLPESQTNTGNRRRLVLKLSIRDSSKALPLESKKSECNILGNVMGLLDKALSEESYQNGTQSCSQDPVPSFVETDDAMLSKSCDGNNKIRWEEVKMLTSMSLGVGDTKHVCSDSDVILDGNHITEDITCRHLKLEEYQRTPINLENGAHQEKLDQTAYVSEKRTAILDALDKGRDNELAPACTSESLVVDEVSLRGHQEDKRSSPLTCNELKSQTRYSDKVYEDLPGASECRGHEPLGGAGMLFDDKTGTGYSCKSSPDCIQEVEERKPIIRKIRIKSKRIMKEPRSPSSGLNSVIAMEDPMSSAGNLISESPMQMHHDLISGVPEGDDGASGSGHGNRNGWSGKLEKQVYEHAELPLAYNSKMQHLDSNGTNAPACKRPTSFRLRTNSEVNSCSVEESESNIIRYNNTDDVCGSRSTGMKATSHNRSSMIYNFEGREGHDSAETSRNAEKLTPNEHEKRGEWKSSSKVTVRLRSAKPKGDDYHSSELSFADRRKSYHSVRKLSWLMLSEHEESYRYIPQQGDEVAYLRQGHQEYIEWRGSREVGPWISIKGNLRAVEFSKVVRLDYSTLPGSGESCCKLTLKFIDPSSNVNGQIFRLTLPELVDFSDFLVERTRYDAAIRRQWTHRDKCQVWWRNENEEGGSWWEGRILSVKPKSLEFPDSPWERYVIQYRSDTSEQHLHSPWELHDLDSQWEHPHIDDWSREKLLSCFAKIEQKRNQDYYGIEKLKQVTQKSDFINRFPVPLSFGVIKRRLENNYYRSLDAFEHDIMVMISNAQFYFGKNTDLILKMRHLSELITHTLSKL